MTDAPSATSGGSDYQLVPVAHDPFAPALIPVDHDPFASSQFDWQQLTFRPIAPSDPADIDLRNLSGDAEADLAATASKTMAPTVSAPIQTIFNPPSSGLEPRKNWMMEPGLFDSGALPEGATLDEVGRPYWQDTGEPIGVVRRPSVLPIAKTPDGYTLAAPKILDILASVAPSLAVGRAPFAIGSRASVGADARLQDPRSFLPTAKNPAVSSVTDAVQATPPEAIGSPVSVAADGGPLGARQPLGTDITPTTKPFAGLNSSVMRDAAEEAALSTRANEILQALGDEKAIKHRTVGVATTWNTRNTMVASGKRDLVWAQSNALKPGEIGVKLPREDAEITMLRDAWINGIILKTIAVTRDICPDCARAIRAFGGEVYGRIAVFPPYPPPDSAGLAVGLTDRFGAQLRLLPDKWDRLP